MESGMFMSYVLSMLLKKIVVPSDYHSQIRAIQTMLTDDVSGLVDSLTDFSVNTATVDFKIETKSKPFNKILKKWLDTINLEYNQIPTGIKPLAKEYFKERWKSSSFPILKIGGWTTIDKLILPTKLFFVDGLSVHAKDLNEEDEDLKLINYEYYLGKKLKPSSKLNKNTIITRPYGRWFDKYPIPYLIKRGIYHNWKIISSIKNMESEILDQIIPYLLLIKKGTAELAKDGTKTYSQEELKGVIEQFQTLMEKMKDATASSKSTKSPIRATNFDEEIKHLIPDMSTIFDPKLFSVAERNILSGLGFIDVIEATSSSRKESILNPKAFIEEAKSGVEDFKQIIKELIFQIIAKNKTHIKYVNTDFYICSSPMKAFMTDEFKRQIQRLWRAGRLSDQTAIELVAEVDFETEVMRRENETKRDLPSIFYPPVADNREGQGIDIPGKDDEEIPEDKTDDIEKKEYDIGENLITAPYTHDKYPTQLKSLPAGARKIWIDTFNAVHKETNDETQARKSAWRNVKLKYIKKNNRWIRMKK